MPGASTLTVPPELGPAADMLAELRDRVLAVEVERAPERQRAGGRVCGRRAVLAQSWRGQPTSREPRRNLRPRVAAQNKGGRIEALLRNRAFVEAYTTARAAWREGVTALFPPGTYWLCRFAQVAVAEG
jgi:putative transposase